MQTLRILSVNRCLNRIMLVLVSISFGNILVKYGPLCIDISDAAKCISINQLCGDKIRLIIVTSRAIVMKPGKITEASIIYSRNSIKKNAYCNFYTLIESISFSRTKTKTSSQLKLKQPTSPIHHASFGHVNVPENSNWQVSEIEGEIESGPNSWLIFLLAGHI